jgi:hypothetical protein
MATDLPLQLEAESRACARRLLLSPAAHVPRPARPLPAPLSQAL